MAKKQPATKNLHTLVVGCFKTYTAAVKSDGADYAAFASLIESITLNDAESVRAVRDDLMATFGEAHKDAAQIRVNVINNARRVAFGGTKDDKAIRGKGHAAMLEVLHSVSSIRELRKVMADAVPEALKGKSGGDRKSDKESKKKIATPKVATREDAMRAAREVLAIVAKFVKPSETALTEWLALSDSVLKD